MDDDLRCVVDQLMQARRPEDAFGRLEGTPEDQMLTAKRLYRKLARQVHPDVNGGSTLASEAYAKLNELWALAEQVIATGTYGRTPLAAVATICSKRRTYAVIEALGKGDLADVYWATAESDPSQTFVLKAARQPADRDLLGAEFDTLQLLHEPDTAVAKKFMAFLPRPVESFGFRDGANRLRQTNVFAGLEGYVSLADVQRAYPSGVDPRDAAWMWRRLLYVLGYAHHRNVIHGAVLPEHVLIRPESHDLMLVGWCYSVRDPRGTAGHIPAISVAYESWYPPEVFAKQPPAPGTDILMGAECMLAVMGGDPATGRMPTGLAPGLRAFFESCLLKLQHLRPQDAWTVLDEFDRLIERLWGKRTFRPFHMPQR